jgi:hypothetical protein
MRDDVTQAILPTLRSCSRVFRIAARAALSTTSRSPRPPLAMAACAPRHDIPGFASRIRATCLVLWYDIVRQLGSRLTDAGQQPSHYLPVWIATGRDSLHRLLSEGLGLLFGLSLVLRKRHPFADDFSPRLVFGLHAQDPLPKRWSDGSMIYQARLWRPRAQLPPAFVFCQVGPVGGSLSRHRSDQGMTFGVVLDLVFDPLPVVERC